ncbi:MAG: type transport system ATP-binding protein [Solirubrobacteraceae bacterium]|nr:type transport system ATP-binding protein [Solirubrobacteraceae bacterium]
MTLRAGLAAAALAGLPAAASAPAANAADPLAELKASCAVRTSADKPPRRAVRYRICSGPIASFDGTKLDATLTLPAHPVGRLPLVVFLHGFLNTKRESLSESRAGNGPDRGGEAYKTVRWNNVWLADRGYAVLNYTARGHEGSEGSIQLASKEYEIRDTRRLTGLLADDPGLGIDTRRVAAVGGSYGGGQAWLLLTTRDDQRLQYGEWRSPGGRLVRLAAIVPQYTWTHLLYALAPSGRHLSSGVDPRFASSPFGIPKITLLDGFLATLRDRITPEIAQSLARVNAGEPYDGDPAVEDAKRTFARDRSAFTQDDFFAALHDRRQRRVPVIALQGWTDPIFPVIEVLRMYRRLKAADPGYPIGIYMGDFEHLTAQAKVPDLVYGHGLANRLLDTRLRGRTLGPAFDVRAAVTDCDPKRMGHIVRSPTWDGLATGRLTFSWADTQVTNSHVSDPRAQDFDPVVRSQLRGRGCITTSGPSAPGVASWEAPVPRDFTQVGLPRLTVTYQATAPDLELNSRLWDMAPDGTLTLIDRGAYRATSAAGTIAYELFGNAWHLRPGHRIRLEVLQDDATYLRPDNFASSATITAARLEIPGR